MGKGDKKTRRGKIIRGTFGNLRLRKKRKHGNVKAPKKE
ncbi:MAG: 30S ribosomal protein THX [Flavobacteriaceae bacterium]